MVLLIALLVAATGGIDYLTGWQFSFSIFYFLPVSIASWHLSRRDGAVTSVICAATWFLAEVGSHPPYDHPGIPVWNAAVRLGMFAITTYQLSQLRRSHDLQAEMARTDILTGVPNGRAFFESAAVELERARRYGHALALAYIDIDNFKRVNDRWGHPAGDALIVEAARAIRARIRESDLVARLGGDEFAVLFPETGLDEARIAGEKLRAALGVVTTSDGEPITVSIGVLACETMPADLDELVRRADSLMYRAKALGKNLVHLEVDTGRDATLQPVEVTTAIHG